MGHVILAERDPKSTVSGTHCPISSMFVMHCGVVCGVWKGPITYGTTQGKLPLTGNSVPALEGSVWPGGSGCHGGPDWIGGSSGPAGP